MSYPIPETTLPRDGLRSDSELDDTHCLMAITARPPQVMVRGDGCFLYDEQGKEYLDMVQGWAVNSLGHCPAEIVAALDSQSRTLISPSPAFHNRPQLRLAERLRSLSGLDQVHFLNSGGEANEAAVKLARKWGQLNKRSGGEAAFEIITTEGAFHGRTLAMMAASGKPGWDSIFAPMPTGFPKIPFGDLAAARAAITDRSVALMVEPIQGEAGVVVPPSDYLRGLRALADEHGLLLILDEVQTGIGRTGSLFAFERAGIKPDILTLAKGLGGGVPIGAVLASEAASCFAHGDQGGTYNGNPLMAAVADSVVSTISQPAFLARVREAGKRLHDRLASLARRHPIVEVRGAGLLVAIELAQPVAERIRDLAFEGGLIINAPRPASLRFMPSLRISDDSIDRATAHLDSAFQSLGG